MSDYDSIEKVERSKAVLQWDDTDGNLSLQEQMKRMRKEKYKDQYNSH